jgi:plastocyanin
VVAAREAREGGAMNIRFAMVVTGLLVCVSCGDDPSGPGGGCEPGAGRVCLTSSTFEPSNISIATGGSVQWIDGSGVSHTVTSNPGSTETFDEPVSSGVAFTKRFNAAGTFSYYCRIHGSPTSGMRGTVTVN